MNFRVRGGLDLRPRVVEHGEADVRFGLALRVEADGFVEVGGRFFGLPGLEVCFAEQVVGVSRLRVLLDRGLEDFDCLLEILRVDAQPPEVDGGGEEVGPHCEGARVAALGLLGVAEREGIVPRSVQER